MSEPVQTFFQRDFSGGMNTRDNPASLNDNEFSLAYNNRISERGIAKKRYGSAPLVAGETSTATISGLFSFFSTSTAEHLYRCQNGIWKEYNGSAFTTAFTTVSTKYSRAIIFDGPTDTIATSGSGTITDATVNTLTYGGGGWTTNSLADKVVKMTTGGSTGEEKVIASNTRNELTIYGQWNNTPIAPSDFTIYETAPQAMVYNGSDTPFKVKTITATKSTRFDLPLIPNLIFALVWNGRVWGFTKNSSKLWFSDISNFESFPDNNYIQIDAGDGQFLQALGITTLGLAIYKDYKTGILTGNSVDTYAFDIRDHKHGCMAPDSVKSWKGISISLDKAGVYAFNGQDNLPIGRPIENQLDTSLALMVNAKANVFDDKYYLSYPATSAATGNNRTLVYDLKFGAWAGIDTLGYNAYTLYGGNNYATKDNTVKVYRLENGTYNDDTATINWQLDTKEWDLGSIGMRKKHKDLFVEAAGITTSTNVNIKSEVDNAGFSLVGNMDIGGAGALWDTAEWDVSIWAGADNLIEKFRIGEKGRNIKLRFTNNTTNQVSLYKYEISFLQKKVK